MRELHRLVCLWRGHRWGAGRVAGHCAVNAIVHHFSCHRCGMTVATITDDM